MLNKNEITLDVCEYTYRTGIKNLQTAQALAECLSYCDFSETGKTSVALAFEAVSNLALEACEQLDALIKNPTLEMRNGKLYPIKGAKNASTD